MQKNTKASQRGGGVLKLKRLIKESARKTTFIITQNGAWLKKTKIPKDEARWGSFVTLRVDTEYQLKDIVDDLLKKKNHKKGSPEQMVSDFYRAASDYDNAQQTRGRTYATAARAYCKSVYQRRVARMFGLLARARRFRLFGTAVGQDDKDSTKYVLYIWQGGLVCPSATTICWISQSKARTRCLSSAYRKAYGSWPATMPRPLVTYAIRL